MPCIHESVKMKIRQLLRTGWRHHLHRSSLSSHHIFYVTLGTFCIGVFYCEYLIYFASIWWCSWPALQCLDGQGGEEAPLRAMILADTHVLGPWAHWLDKARREWQMWRSFQTALYLLQPAVVFILGDLFDKADVTSLQQFEEDLRRFRVIFSVPSHIPLICAAGNHDIGFHYKISDKGRSRFERRFVPKSVYRYSLSGMDFVILNSMAFENDGCTMCREAQKLLSDLSRSLNKAEVRPVVLQHFPLYRESDAECSQDDAAPSSEKNISFRPKWDCLSREASQELLEKLSPRALFSGHTHHGCYQEHFLQDGEPAPEWTVASFNWRNKINPSFLMVSVCKSELKVGRCHLPNEHTVFFLYGLLISLIVLGGLIITFRFKASSKLKK
ncbi:metallophosphoesterase 1-like [Paramacrobiotus metropolitanus]|uniref:metallophosphoesterase 1-like n=1 Tax=Paramacrobiotus metropolitanus TaxID=2943436 RepID=UPI0024457441|nr:metallophosphoesterase 1-like [Paramacrobiotus metropolitanus]